MKLKAPAWKIAAEIETRQDEVLRQLDELNERVKRALSQLGVEVNDEAETAGQPTNGMAARAA